MKTWLPLAILGPLVLAGCPTNTPVAGSTLSLGITDAAVDEAEAVIVRFSGVQLLDAQGNAAVSITLEQPRSIDVLAQQGGLQASLLDEQDVPAGTYPRLRLIIDPQTNASCQQAQANPNHPTTVVVDGTSYPLVIPGGNDGGLTVEGPITIGDDENAEYTLDFDLRKSIHRRGNSGCYSLKPTFRLVRTSDSGTLSGNVAPTRLQNANCSANPSTGQGAAVYLYAGSNVTPDDVDGGGVEPVSSTRLIPGSSGGSTTFTYTAGFLAPGAYTAAFTCQAGDDEPDSNEALIFQAPSNVTIRSGAATDLDF